MKNHGKHRSIVSRSRFEMRSSVTQNKSGGLSTKSFGERMLSLYYPSPENGPDRIHPQTLNAIQKCSGAQPVTCVEARNLLSRVNTAGCIFTHCHRETFYCSKTHLFYQYRSLRTFYIGWKVFAKPSLTRGRCTVGQRKCCLGVTLSQQINIFSAT